MSRKPALKSNRTVCVMGLWDAHVPYHQPEVLDLFFQVAADYKPDVVILGGDNLDCTAVSSHAPSAKIRVEQPIDGDFSKLDEILLKPIEALRPKKKVAFLGNHCQWLSDYTESHPEIGDSLDVVKQLRLRSRGWEVIPYKGFWELGRLVFHHGDFRSSRRGFGGSTKHAAHDMVNKIHKSIRAGHIHTLQMYSIANQLHPDSPHTGMSLPCACRLDLPYLENSATNWVQGFYIGWIRPDGTFSDYPLVVINGKLTFAGKTYVARTRKFTKRTSSK